MPGSVEINTRPRLSISGMRFLHTNCLIVYDDGLRQLVLNLIERTCFVIG